MYGTEDIQRANRKIQVHPGSMAPIGNRRWPPEQMGFDCWSSPGIRLVGSTPPPDRASDEQSWFSVVDVGAAAFRNCNFVIYMTDAGTYPPAVHLTDGFVMGATPYYSLATLHYETPSEISPWNTLFSDLDRWSILPFDWDGSEGHPPSAAAASAAHAFAITLRSNGLPVPQHFIAGDGEISFDWREDGAAASVSFFQDGSLAGYYQSSPGEALLEFETASIRDLGSFTKFFEALKRFA